MNKQELLTRGEALMSLFCGLNGLEVPPVFVRSRAEWPFGARAYYRPTKIEICLEACAHVGTAGRSWSFPGYSVDRTPFGVIAHELGHHADVTKSSRSRGYLGDYSVRVRAESGEERLTSYCPNDGEWFAEMFRLFVTNPNLLKAIRPRTHALLARDFQPVVKGFWEEVLSDAPDRTLMACRRKVDEARRKYGA